MRALLLGLMAAVLLAACGSDRKDSPTWPQDWERTKQTASAYLARPLCEETDATPCRTEAASALVAQTVADADEALRHTFKRTEQERIVYDAARVINDAISGS